MDQLHVTCYVNVYYFKNIVNGDETGFYKRKYLVEHRLVPFSDLCFSHHTMIICSSALMVHHLVLILACDVFFSTTMVKYFDQPLSNSICFFLLCGVVKVCCHHFLKHTRLEYFR